MAPGKGVSSSTAPGLFKMAVPTRVISRRTSQRDTVNGNWSMETNKQENLMDRDRSVLLLQWLHFHPSLSSGGFTSFLCSLSLFRLLLVVSGKVVQSAFGSHEFSRSD